MEIAEKRIKLSIGGMTCVNCQNKIEKKLKSTAGIINARVSCKDGTADITYNEGKLSLNKIIAVIEKLDYEVLTGKKQQKTDLVKLICMLVIIISLYVLLSIPMEKKIWKNVIYAVSLVIVIGSCVVWSNLGTLLQNTAPSIAEAANVDGVQVVNSTLSAGVYLNITV